MIPLDAETERCVALGGHTLEDVLPSGEELLTRKTANLHMGGTIHDVTDELHPRLAEAAVAAARAIEIPVVGIDFIVSTPRAERYAFIEANERPGLANHEPQPTAERFVDLLFPLSIPAAVRTVIQHSELHE
jgi:D-alanine-D-alanine ligase-like ATP-grasp enzyme